MPLLPEEDLIEAGYDITAAVENNVVYNSNNKYPSIAYTTPSIQIKKGYVFVTLNLYPVEYFPLTGEVYYYKDITVKVKTMPGEVDKTFRGKEKDKTKIIDNYNSKLYDLGKAKDILSISDISESKKEVKNIVLDSYPTKAEASDKINNNIPSDLNIPLDNNIPSDLNIPLDNNIPSELNIPLDNNVPSDLNIPLDNNVPAKDMIAYYIQEDKESILKLKYLGDSLLGSTYNITVVPMDGKIIIGRQTQEYKNLQNSKRLFGFLILGVILLVLIFIFLLIIRIIKQKELDNTIESRKD